MVIDAMLEHFDGGTLEDQVIASVYVDVIRFLVHKLTCKIKGIEKGMIRRDYIDGKQYSSL